MRVCVTGATGYIGAHVAKLAAGSFGELRVTSRSEGRLAYLDAEPVKADVTDRASLRRAFKGCELVFHSAGFVGSRPRARVWEVNALGPRLVVEAAAAEGVRRVVLTSSVAALGPVSEDGAYRSVGLAYPDAKHEGEAEALAAGVRLGVEVVVVNPAYVLGRPLGSGEGSNRIVGSYLRGRLPAVVDGRVGIAHVADVARGHMRASSKGTSGERYVLGGPAVGWVELFERVAELSGVHNPLVLVPVEAARVLDQPGVALMGLDWTHSSAKARRELGYRSRALDRTLRDTIDWYLSRGLSAGPPSPYALAALGVRLAGRVGILRGVQVVEGRVGRRLVVRP